MSNKTYDIMKKLSLNILPAVSVFYVAMAKVWGLSYSAEVVGTISAIEVLIGACLSASCKHYNRTVEEVEE